MHAVHRKRESLALHNAGDDSRSDSGRFATRPAASSCESSPIPTPQRFDEGALLHVVDQTAVSMLRAERRRWMRTENDWASNEVGARETARRTVTHSTQSIL
jgi:hypothetical protein